MTERDEASTPTRVGLSDGSFWEESPAHAYGAGVRLRLVVCP